MIKYFTFFFILIVFVACDRAAKIPITEVNEAVAFEKLFEADSVHSALEHDDILRKLYALQNLKWPIDADSLLYQMKLSDGITFPFIALSVDYYLQKQDYQKILQLAEDWQALGNPEDDVLRWKIMALSAMGDKDQTVQLLESFQSKNQDTDDLKFVAECYLTIGDSTGAMDPLEKLSRQELNDPMIRDYYLPILIERHSFEKALELVDISDLLLTESLAVEMYKEGMNQKAKKLLKSNLNDRSAKIMANWYLQENQRDSAILYLDSALVFSADKETYYQKAEVLESMGRLTQSLQVYQSFLADNPSDSIAEERAANLERKIAYLRNIRERENKIPVLNLPSKKSTDNE